MGLIYGNLPHIVSDGLMLNVDASNPDSYPGSGTTWYDLSGNGHHGTLLNGASFDSNNSIDFNGGTDGAQFVMNLNTSGYSDITISGWINITSGGTWYRWFSGANGTDMHKPDLAILSNGDIGYNSTTLTTGWVDTSKSIGLFTWTNVCYVISANGNFKTYINSTLVFSDTYTSGVFPSSFNVMLGNRYDLNGEAVTGKISATMIYNRGLTDDEILQNYYALTKRF